MDIQTIIKAIEYSACLMPDTPGCIEYLPIFGVRACVTPVSHHAANTVSNSQLSREEADTTIEKVCACYRERKKAFGWMVGPPAPQSSTPAFLP